MTVSPSSARPDQAPGDAAVTLTTVSANGSSSAPSIDLHVDPVPVRRWISQIAPAVPGLMIVLGLLMLVVGELPAQRGLVLLPAVPDPYEALYHVLRVIAPVLVILGFYLQARQILAGAIASLDDILTNVNRGGQERLADKLELLDKGLSLCRYASSKGRPILLLAATLLLYGIPVILFVASPLEDRWFPDFDDPDPIEAILFHRAPSIAALTGFILIVWHTYQAARLREFRKYIVDERAAVIGKMRIMDRYADRYVEVSSLTEQVSDLIRVNEGFARSDAHKNTILLLLGVILSSLISIVGILGGANMLTFGEFTLNGNVVSAILGVVVASIITVQNTFRLAERSRFQRQVASDARKLFMELVYSVDTSEKLQAVLRDYQRLSDRSVRDVPTTRELEAPVESRVQQRDRGESAPS